MLNNTFDGFYSQLMDSNPIRSHPILWAGRNLVYSENLVQVDDLIVTGYAVFMRFAAIDYLGLAGAPFNGYLPYVDFENDIRALDKPLSSEPGPQLGKYSRRWQACPTVGGNLRPIFLHRSVSICKILTVPRGYLMCVEERCGAP